MIYHMILCYMILYHYDTYTISYYIIVPYYMILCHMMQYCIMWYDIVSFDLVLYCTIWSCIAWFDTMSYYILQYCVIWSCIVWYCTIWSCIQCRIIFYNIVSYQTTINNRSLIIIFILHDKIVELCNLWLHIMMFCLMSMIISACIYYMKPSLPLMSTFSVEYRTILKSWSQANYDMYYQYVFPISRL